MDDEDVARQLQRDINGMRPASPRKHGGPVSRSPSPRPAAGGVRKGEGLGLHRGLMLVDMHESDVAWTLLFGWTAECLNTCHMPESGTHVSITMVREKCHTHLLMCC